ncbi:MAG: hypothetical protein M3081_20015 [Gemmatimonadota bacterium]|nr:hypothetical protein [Gemmatimonadota bacterium]
MHERELSGGLRVLVGVLGVLALGSALALGVTELRMSAMGARPRVARLLVIALAVIAIGGVVLLRGAVRGRIAARDNRR